MTRLIDELNALHDRYAHAVNAAITADDLDQAHQLAAAYDDEAIHLIAEREGLTHLLPIRRPTTADSGLRARIRRLVARAA
jgi:hypothetical protein